ncbi:MAG TPA: PAS domain S-box protein [Terriglobales bacterium]|nr:PAS domain S-box protein [Terriglobales bacterium]
MRHRPFMVLTGGGATNHGRRRWVAYLLAVVVSALMLWPSLKVPDAHASPVFLFFYIAVVFVAWFGGLGPALASAILTALESWYFILPTAKSFDLPSSGDVIRLLTYLATATATAMVVAHLRELRARTLALLTAEQQARNAAAEAERRNASLLESIGDAFYSVDADWRFTYLNSHAERVLRRTRQDLIGKSIWDEFPETRGTVLEESYRNVVNQDEAQSFEFYYAPLSIWAEVRAYPRDDGGVSVFFQDVSDRHRLIAEVESNAQRFEKTFNLAAAGIAHVALDGRWLRVNQRMCEIVGYTQAELLSKTFQDITHPEDLEKDVQLYDRVKAGEIDRYTLEKRYLHKNGSTIWVSLSVSLMEETGGEKYAIGVVEDISEHKYAEEELSKANAIIESSHDAIYSMTLEGVITSWNAAAARLYGYTKEEAIGSSMSLVVPTERQAELLNFFSRLAKGEEVGHYDTVRKRKDGSLVDVSVNISPVLDDSGRVVEASIVARDITQLKLRTSELESVLKNAPVGFAFFDREHRYLRVNEALAAINGLPPEAHLGKPISEVLPVNAQFVDPILDDVFRTGRTIEREITGETPKEPGVPRTWITGFYPVYTSGAEPVAVGAYVVEITDRKRAEERLRESEERFRALADNMSQLAWMADPSGSIFWYNRRWFDYTGTTLEEMQGWGWQSVHHPDHVKRVVEKIRRCFESGDVWEDLFPIRGRDGEYRWFLSRAVPIRDEKGRVLRWFGTNTDVTDQRRAEDVLRERGQQLIHANQLAETRLAQFRTTIDSMTEGVYVGGANGEPLLTNPAFLRIYGFPPDSPLESIWKLAVLLEAHDLDGNLVPPSEWPVTQVLNGQTVSHRELVVRRTDTGKEMVLSHNGAPVRDESGRVIMVVVTVEDVTAIKNAQKALLQSEKLASVGRMAATIAHEINNPLETIMNAVYLAASHPDLPESALKHLTMAESELERVAHITRQTLGFYREPGAPTMVCLSEVVKSVIDLFAPRLKARDIRVQEEIQQGVEIKAIKGELRQIISNMLSNSIDAMNGSGSLHVRIRPFTLDGERKFVRITMGDTGSGIAPEHLATIFEPFFTTKAELGTGLGLWVTRELVQKHGGHIRVRSKKGRGTVFNLWFPMPFSSSLMAAD